MINRREMINFGIRSVSNGGYYFGSELPEMDRTISELFIFPGIPDLNHLLHESSGLLHITFIFQKSELFFRPLDPVLL